MRRLKGAENVFRVFLLGVGKEGIREGEEVNEAFGGGWGLNVDECYYSRGIVFFVWKTLL